MRQLLAQRCAGGAPQLQGSSAAAAFEFVHISGSGGGQWVTTVLVAGPPKHLSATLPFAWPAGGAPIHAVLSLFLPPRLLLPCRVRRPWTAEWVPHWMSELWAAGAARAEARAAQAAAAAAVFWAEQVEPRGRALGAELQLVAGWARADAVKVGRGAQAGAAHANAQLHAFAARCAAQMQLTARHASWVVSKAYVTHLQPLLRAHVPSWREVEAAVAAAAASAAEHTEQLAMQARDRWMRSLAWVEGQVVLLMLSVPALEPVATPGVATIVVAVTAAALLLPPLLLAARALILALVHRLRPGSVEVVAPGGAAGWYILEEAAGYHFQQPGAREAVLADPGSRLVWLGSAVARLLAARRAYEQLPGAGSLELELAARAQLEPAVLAQQSRAIRLGTLVVPGPGVKSEPLAVRRAAQLLLALVGAAAVDSGFSLDRRIFSDLFSDLFGSGGGGGSSIAARRGSGEGSDVPGLARNPLYSEEDRAAATKASKEAEDEEEEVEGEVLVEQVEAGLGAAVDSGASNGGGSMSSDVAEDGGAGQGSSDGDAAYDDVQDADIRPVAAELLDDDAGWSEGRGDEGGVPMDYVYGLDAAQRITGELLLDYDDDGLDGGDGVAGGGGKPGRDSASNDDGENSKVEETEEEGRGSSAGSNGSEAQE